MRNALSAADRFEKQQKCDNFPRGG